MIGSTKLTQITRRKLSDEVADRLETAIRDGTFKAGSSLPSERELMAMFGVGRPSIREALYALRKAGVIQISSGERSKVVQPTPRHLLNELGLTVRHLLESREGLLHFEQARLALEGFLVRYAACDATDEQIKRLGTALAENEAAIGAQNWVATDVAFHRILAEIPGNPIFVAMHDAIVEWMIGQRPALADPIPNNRMSYAGHAAIFDAVASRDQVRAIGAMETHLGDAHRRYFSN